MNTSAHIWSKSLVAVAVGAALAVGCASAPKKPAGSEQVRAKLTALQNDAALAAKAAVATKEAEAAVGQAEIVQPDLALAAHRVYIADRKVDTARAQAETKAAEENRTALAEQGERARLDARTREADLAKTDAMTARAENEQQKVAATQARSDADASQQQASELQRQLEILQAKPTDRGLVLTLGDTLFATGKSEIKSGTSPGKRRQKSDFITFLDFRVLVSDFLVHRHQYFLLGNQLADRGIPLVHEFNDVLHRLPVGQCQGQDGLIARK